jgi:hypothetical protein
MSAWCTFATKGVGRASRFAPDSIYACELHDAWEIELAVAGVCNESLPEEKQIAWRIGTELDEAL